MENREIEKQFGIVSPKQDSVLPKKRIKKPNKKYTKDHI